MMMTNSHRPLPRGYMREIHKFPQALHMLGAALVLFMVVGLFTARNIQITDTYVSGLMAERGKAIIEVFEGSLRNEMRMRSGLRVQEFLEDLASGEDISFIALILESGTIVAHSNPERVGQQLDLSGKPATPELMKKFHDRLMAQDSQRESPALPLLPDKSNRLGELANIDELDELDGPEALDSPDETSGRLFRIEGALSYVVHHSLARYPIVTIHKPGTLQNFNPMVRHASPLAPTATTELKPLEILVALDSMPLIKMQEQNMRSALFSGFLILVAGLALIVALRYVEHGMESRRRMRVAETLAQSMVDEVRRLEKEMRRREKLAAVGDLAAGVAHELRNPLSSIKGYATYFRSRFPEGSEDREAARIMVQEVDRLNRVISDLIGVSKPTDIHPVSIDAKELVESIIRLLAQDASQQNVSLSIEGESLTVLMDPDRMRQAVLNVCLNALEAFQEEENRGDIPGEIALVLSREEDMARLEIRDNGPGIPPETLNRIFDPYFTTKSKGTGLGLMIVLKIVEAHGGSAQVFSEEGKGTSVILTLPLSETFMDIEQKTEPAKVKATSGINQLPA